jgi:hypothetical protein
MSTPQFDTPGGRSLESIGWLRAQSIMKPARIPVAG